MLKTILSASLGDDGRDSADGRGEDATVNRLEDMAAALPGKEAAVLLPPTAYMWRPIRVRLRNSTATMNTTVIVITGVGMPAT